VVGLVVAIAMAVALVPSLLPACDRIAWEGRSVAAAVIFAGSYLALAIRRIPGLSIDRAGIALVGAGLMVASGALTQAVRTPTLAGYWDRKGAKNDVRSMLLLIGGQSRNSQATRPVRLAVLPVLAGHPHLIGVS
jgi:hypothetical protein